jgi:hypothetical protein
MKRVEWGTDTVIILTVRADVARLIINNLRIAAARLRTEDSGLATMLTAQADEIERQAMAG